MPSRVLLGNEALLRDARRLLAHRRYALVVHCASITSRGIYLHEALWEDPKTRPYALLVPEHGFFGERAYMEAVSDSTDPKTGLQIKSLYKDDEKSLTPDRSFLSLLDAVVFDLQDIGCRYYTYLATMAKVMEACAEARVQFIVTDRPNPIGGLAVEGGLVAANLKSFVSYLPLPNRHGLTAGEVAKWYATTSRLEVDLIVFQMAGYRRGYMWRDTGLPFVPPSPNIPDPETALLYPGMCLLEGTNLSEGRGTTTPFKVFGAPFIKDPWALAKVLNEMKLPGVAFRPHFFVPAFDKWAKQRCGGLQVLILDEASFRPYLTGIAIISACMRLFKGDFDYRRTPYEFVQDRLAIDLLLGNETLRLALESGAHPYEVQALWLEEEKAFREVRRAFLLYPEGQ